MASLGREHQHHTLHLHGGLHRRELSSVQGQPENRLPSPCRLEGSAGTREGIRGEVQHAYQRRQGSQQGGRSRLRQFLEGAAPHLRA